MLVLRRRPEETIKFPDLGITIRVIDLHRGTVRFGIEAPENVKILRGELEQTGMPAKPVQTWEAPKQS